MHEHQKVYIYVKRYSATYRDHVSTVEKKTSMMSIKCCIYIRKTIQMFTFFSYKTLKKILSMYD